MATLRWKTLSSRSGPEIPLFDVRLDKVEHPESGAQMERLVLASTDWVNMVALTRQGQCVMVEQHRFGIRDLTLETPGGMVDPGEDSQTAAQRELLEETGYGGGRWRYLGAVQPNPAIHDHLCHHWLAEDVELIAAQDLGGGEAIAVHCMPPTEVVAAARRGEIAHALALSALARVFPLWQDWESPPA